MFSYLAYTCHVTTRKHTGVQIKVLPGGDSGLDKKRGHDSRELASSQINSSLAIAI